MAEIPIPAAVDALHDTENGLKLIRLERFD